MFEPERQKKSNKKNPNKQKQNKKPENKTELTFPNFKRQFRTYSFRLLLFFSIKCGLPNVFLNKCGKK